MRIYTTYFGRVKDLPKDIVPISIALKTPPGWKYATYPALAPTPSILADWRANGDVTAYKLNYRTKVLNKLHVIRVLYDLQKLSKGKDIALVCYEKTGDFCHRYDAGDWLNVGVLEYVYM